MLLKDSVIVKVSLEIAIHINNFPILCVGPKISRPKKKKKKRVSIVKNKCGTEAYCITGLAAPAR